MVKRERNHEEHKDMHEVHKVNPCQIRSIRVFRVPFKKGTQMTRIQRIHTEINSQLFTLNNPCVPCAISFQRLFATTSAVEKKNAASMVAFSTESEP